MSNIIRTQVLRFIIVGSLAVLCDFVVYILTYKYIGVDISKIISFLSGSIVAYYLNKYWTFDRNKRSFSEKFRFAFLYICTLLINIITNHLILDYSNHISIGFIVATGVSTVLNFIGQKWWVFKV